MILTVIDKIMADVEHNPPADLVITTSIKEEEVEEKEETIEEEEAHL